MNSVPFWEHVHKSCLFISPTKLAQVPNNRLHSSVQSLSHVRLFATPWTAAHQASLSITNSRSLLKLMPIESVMPSNHLIPCCSLLLLPSILPSIRVFFNESALWMRWPKYWSFSFSISPSNEHPGLVSFRMDWSTNTIGYIVPYCNRFIIFFTWIMPKKQAQKINIFNPTVQHLEKHNSTTTSLLFLLLLQDILGLK